MLRKNCPTAARGRNNIECEGDFSLKTWGDVLNNQCLVSTWSVPSVTESFEEEWPWLAVIRCMYNCPKSRVKLQPVCLAYECSGA